MAEYTEKLRLATAQLAASQAQLDQEIEKLPKSISPEDRNVQESKLRDQHSRRRSKIKQEYGAPTPKSTSKSPPKFPYFARLPIELQVVVWKFALPGPRTVPIIRKKKVNGLMSPCAPPVVMHVCRTSRRIALEQGYELVFGTKEFPASMYFNFEQDTAFIDDHDLFANITGHGWNKTFSSPESASRIKRLALGLDVFIAWSPPGPASRARIDIYHSLKTLTFTPFLNYEWLRFGDVDPSDLHEDLIPYLGKQVALWREGIRERHSNGVLQPVDTVQVSLITNAMSHPWMMPRVQQRWDTAMERNLKDKLEYVLDPNQAIAVMRGRLSVFDKFTSICDSPYTENVAGDLDMQQMFDMGRHLANRLRTFPGRYFEKPKSNKEMDEYLAKDRADRSRRLAENLANPALRAMAARDGPPLPSGIPRNR